MVMAREKARKLPFGITVALPDGAVLATDGLLSGGADNEPFSYYDWSKIGWIPGRRACCAIVAAGLNQGDPRWPLGHFGLLPECSSTLLADPWDFVAEASRLHEVMAQSSARAQASFRESRPDYYASIDPTWYTPHLLAIDFSGEQPRAL